MNAEHVASTTPVLHEGFLKAVGKTSADDDPSNELVATEQHLTWLNAAGFEDVDCFWKWRELAVVGGVHRTLV